MGNVDLKGMPFFLKEDDISWVEKTKKGMSLDEKIGQLFFLIGFTTKNKELKEVVNKINPGGMMYRTAPAAKVNGAYKVLQENSKVPMLLAANLEAGGDGLIDEGTHFGNNMLVAATDDVDQARKLGLVCGREARAVGANMAFAPVIDINYNFRNPITNTRSFGDDPERIAKMGAAYVKGAQEGGISVTIKHFPGDGTDGRDQHLVTTHNNLSYKDWMRTFGKIYTESIKGGARGLMVGHIGLPGYFEGMNEEHADLKEMPATLNPILMNKLLREELGYNGLTMTDASLMTGFGEKGKRKDLVPQSIAAGCDMFLFTRQPEDDYKHMMNGYKNGVITEERLDEALTRILAIKAALGLHKKSPSELVPNGYTNTNAEEHKKWANEAADKSVTLVKDEQGLLPLDPFRHKKIGVMYNGNAGGMEVIMKNLPGFKGFLIRTMMKLSGGKKKTVYEKLVDNLKERGFNAFFYDFSDIMAIIKDMQGKTLEDWNNQFDAIIYLAKWDVMSNQTSLQLQFKAMGFDAPWFVEEVPTLLVSLGNPYHGYDLPMVKTIINGYDKSDAVIKAVADKIAGKSAFTGVSPVKQTFKEFYGELDK